MILTFLLMFLKTLDNIEIDLRNTAKDDEQNLRANVHFKNTPLNRDMSLQNGELPALVPLEFPEELYENGAVDVLEAVKKKLENFFGETMTGEVMKIESSDGVFDYLSKADFHSNWINGIINNVGNILKSTQSPLIGIKSKKQCKKICRKNQSSVMSYLQTSIQNVISSLTKEDFRFEFAQDPKKSFSFDSQLEHCKCLDGGYMVKVSPRLKELMEKRFLKSGKSLSEIILEDEPMKTVTHYNDFLSWRNMANMGMYVTGWKSRAKRDVDNDIGEFIAYHGLIAILLFIFCHCLFYFYLIYVLIAFFNNFVF